MPLIDSKSGKIRKEYNLEGLKEAANLMRGYSLISLAAAGSGHAGGTLSIMDVAAALYLAEAKHYLADPFWPERDRIFWSTGHKAPALYVSLGISGYFRHRGNRDTPQTLLSIPGPSPLAQARRHRSVIAARWGRGFASPGRCARCPNR